MEEKDIIKDFGKWDVPSKWDDVTLKIYQDIERYYADKEEKQFDVRDVLHILTNRSIDEINELPSDFLDTILTHLLFLVTTPSNATFLLS